MSVVLRFISSVVFTLGVIMCVRGQSLIDTDQVNAMKALSGGMVLLLISISTEVSSFRSFYEEQRASDESRNNRS